MIFPTAAALGGTRGAPALPAMPSAPLPEQTFFTDPAIDRLLGVTMALAAEVYVLRDRLHAIEARTGALAATQPTPDADAAAFVARLFAPLAGEQEAKGPL